MNPRPPVRRRLAVLTLVLATAAPLAACGGEDPQSWVGTFCGTGTSLRKVLSDANAHLKSALATNTPPASIETMVAKDAATVAAATAKSTNRIRGAGDPGVAEGQGIELAAVSLYDGIDAQARAMQVTASSLSGLDAEALTTALGPYSQQVADLGARLAQSFTAISGYKGYPKIVKASKTPDDYGTVDTCARLQAVAP